MRHKELLSEARALLDDMILNDKDLVITVTLLQRRLRIGYKVATDLAVVLRDLGYPVELKHI